MMSSLVIGQLYVNKKYLLNENHQQTIILLSSIYGYKVFVIKWNGLNDILQLIIDRNISNDIKVTLLNRN